MDKVSFPYRATTHLAFLHVVAESGSWAKHGLEVDYNWQIAKSDAHNAVAKGDVEFVGGNHLSTYGKRVHGDKWVYLGQTQNTVQCKLVVRPESGINGVNDLRGRRIGTRGSHPGLNDWLFLKQRGLDEDRGDFEFVRDYNGQGVAEDVEHLEGAAKEAAMGEEQFPLWTWVANKHVDAAIVMSPGHYFAADAGLKVIDIEPLPMIWYTTISSSLPFVEKHPGVVERFLKGLLEGVHFLKTRRDDSIRIIEQYHIREGKLNREQATYLYNEVAPAISPNLYPTMAAIGNVYEIAKRYDRNAEKVNPMALWDLHYVRRLDDSGFVDSLYSSSPKQTDPDLVAQRKQENESAVAAIKKCGHSTVMNCGC